MSYPYPTRSQVEDDIRALRCRGFRVTVTEAYLSRIGLDLADWKLSDAELYSLSVVIGNEHNECELKASLLQGTYTLQYYEDGQLLSTRQSRIQYGLPGAEWASTRW